jgi:hypothetical protein
MRFYPLIPLWLILLSGAAAFAAVWHTARYGMDIPPRRIFIQMVLRLAAIAVAIAMLLNPGIIIRELNRQRSNVIFLLDGSGSMNTADMPGGKSRLESAKAFLGSLNRADFSNCRKRSYVFSSKTTPVDSKQLQIYNARNGSDLKRAFSALDQDIGFSRIAAVILLTDGLDHSGFSGAHAGLPVFAVKFGSEMNDVPDLRLDSFQAPESLRANEEMSLNVPVALSGFKTPASAELKIIVDGRLEKTENIELKPGENKIIEFRKSFAASGIHTVLLKLNQLPNEAGYLNNEREIAIEVKEGKSETVCYFPVLTNSFRPLVRLLLNSGKKFTALYKLKADSYNVMGADIDQAFKNGIPATPAAMKQADVFVLGGNRDGLLSDAESSALEQYVSNGGNLILLGGAESFGQLPPASPLASMMPVKSAKIQFVSGNFKITPPEQNKSSFSSRLAELCGSETELIRGINLVDSVKEGAETLLWAEGEGRYPLVIALPYGRGKVIAVLTNSLHLWGKGSQRDMNFRAFWEQMLAYAGSSRDDALKVTISNSELLPGEKLKVTALSSLSDAEQTDPDFKIESAIYPADSQAAAAALALTRKGQLYAAEFPELKPGKYILQTICRNKTGNIGKRYMAITAGDALSENYDLKATNDNFLKFCASGRIYGVEEKSALLKDVLGTIQKNDIEREWHPVFETPFFFSALLVFLVAGWYLRRRFNLF